jgi:glutamate synthase (NADPH/NADH) small chain
MVPVPGTLRQLEADLILLAMGFVHPVHEGLLEELGVKFDPRKNVHVDQMMATSVNKVFATGDAVNGASLVVTAIASGRRVARRIDDFLNSSDDQ